METPQKSIGHDIYALIEQLYPICRSITGAGVRSSLGILQQYIPLNCYEIPSGTVAFDWIVPKEWNIRDAYIKNSRGEKIVDFKKSNLHVVNYSMPIHSNFSLEELIPHLHTIPENPDWIPYRTSYYKENWGFCLPHKEFEKLEPGEYEVYIDSSLEDGNLTYGEYFIPGVTEEEILLHTHICHPSLCNDNLSGMSLLTYLAKTLSSRKNRYSYRIVFNPGTIGAIAWLSNNEQNVTKIKHGLVVGLLGDKGRFNYKKSRRGNAEIDKVTEFVLQRGGAEHSIHEFSPYGYDERQFCSPGFNLPVGRFTRSPNDGYPEYHTSADDLEFVSAEKLQESYQILLAIIDTLEVNRYFISQNPKCEPQLGKRGLFETIGGNKNKKQNEMALLWLLNLSDGNHSLVDIARISKLDFSLLAEASDLLIKAKLLLPFIQDNIFQRNESP